MKVFPLLIKDLLETQQATLEAGMAIAPTENPASWPERNTHPQQSPQFQVSIPSENPSSSPEANPLVVEIPDVTDPPAVLDGTGEDSSIRLGGRLFSPNLSARILLGGGVVLFLIAALPMFFRTAQPPEHGNNHSTTQGKPVSATGSATPQKIQTDFPNQAVSSASAPSGSGPSAQQAKANAQPTTTGRQTGTTSPAKSAQQSAQSKPAQQSGSTKKPPDQGAGTTQLASRTVAGGQKSSEREGIPSPPSPGPPSGPSSSGQQTPAGQAPSASSTRLADIRSQLPGPNAHDPTGGVGKDAFQGGIAPGETPLPGQTTNPSGYSLDTRPPTVYYPTSANYPIPPNSQMVYYPSTDGRWYPVMFPPGRTTRSSEATYVSAVSADAIGQPQVLGRQEPVTHPGGPSAGWAWPRNPYQEVSRREPPYTGGFGYPNQQDASYQPPSDRIHFYPSTRMDRVPSGPAGYHTPGPSTQYSAPSGRFPPTTPGNNYQPYGGVPAGQFQPFRSTGNARFGSQEPGIARFNGTIEKPLIRSAYDGTGSSLY